MRIPLLFLLLACLSQSAPTPTREDHELVAKQFYGSLLEKFTRGKHGELFDIIHAKWEHFYPGLITAETATEIRTAFITLREKQGKDNKGFSLSLLLSVTHSIQSIQTEIVRRVKKLSFAGIKFVRKTFAKFPKEFSSPTQIGPLSEKFDAFRAEYNQLGWWTKMKMVKQFPIFKHLDEVNGLVTVFDNLLEAAYTTCDNLPGFSECEHLVPRGEIPETNEETTKAPEIL